MKRVWFIIAIVLLVLTVAASLTLYFVHDDSVEFDSSWAIAAYTGAALSGIAFGLTFA